MACASEEQGRKADSLKSRTAHFAPLLSTPQKEGLCRWIWGEHLGLRCSVEPYCCVLHLLGMLSSSDISGHVPCMPLLPFYAAGQIPVWIPPSGCRTSVGFVGRGGNVGAARQSLSSI